MNKALALIIASGWLLATSAFAERLDHQEFPSPDGRWQVVADWNYPHDGYAWHLQDQRNGKIWFNDTDIGSNEVLPYRFAAIWSPDGKYVAISLHYGRIANEVDIYDTAGGKPHNVPLIPDSWEYDDYCKYADSWKNNTDLIVGAWRCNTKTPSGECSLMIRFAGDRSILIERFEN